jgi:hypothetical protein
MTENRASPSIKGIWLIYYTEKYRTCLQPGRGFTEEYRRKTASFPAAPYSYIAF